MIQRVRNRWKSRGLYVVCRHVDVGRCDCYREQKQEKGWNLGSISQPSSNQQNASTNLGNTRPIRVVFFIGQSQLVSKRRGNLFIVSSIENRNTMSPKHEVRAHNDSEAAHEKQTQLCRLDPQFFCFCRTFQRPPHVPIGGTMAMNASFCRKCATPAAAKIKPRGYGQVKSLHNSYQCSGRIHSINSSKSMTK